MEPCSTPPQGAPQPQYFCFSVSQENSGVILPVVHNNGQAVRQRRLHTKSRSGCEICKERRVKCDETRPFCRNCGKGGRMCNFRVRTPRSKSSHQSQQVSHQGKETPLANPSRQGVGGIPKSPSSLLHNVSLPMNLSQLQLFHHFARVTSETLIFSPYFWMNKVLPVAFQNDFIMHAILAVSASHLRHLQPDEYTHRTAELRHLSLALQGFRVALSSPITRHNANGLFSCALLLFHHAWTDVKSQPQDPRSIAAFQADTLFPLSRGLHHLVLDISANSLRDASFFSAMVTKKTIRTIETYAQRSSYTSEISAFFSQSYHSMRRPTGDPLDDSTDAAYNSAVQRLVPILSILRLRDRGNKDIMPEDLARYLFTWPAKSSDHILHLASQNEEAAKLLLLHYYTAVEELLPERYWWAKKRSEHFGRMIMPKPDDGYREGCRGV